MLTYSTLATRNLTIVRAPPMDRGRALTESPERFDERVGQLAVRAPDDDCALVRAFVRERVADIALAVVAPPAHYVIRDEVHQRAPRIHQPERYAGQQSKQELHGGEWRAVRAII